MAYYNITAYVGNNATLSVLHMFKEQKKYNMTIVITDNKIGYLNHTVELKQPVVIYIQPAKAVVIWDWWDYTSLGFVLMIPVLIDARMLLISRRRKRLEEQGISLEEAKLRRELHLDSPDGFLHHDEHEQPAEGTEKEEEL